MAAGNWIASEVEEVVILACSMRIKQMLVVVFAEDSVLVLWRICCAYLEVASIVNDESMMPRAEILLQHEDMLEECYNLGATLVIHSLFGCQGYQGTT